MFKLLMYTSFGCRTPVITGRRIVKCGRKGTKKSEKWKVKSEKSAL